MDRFNPPPHQKSTNSTSSKLRLRAPPFGRMPSLTNILWVRIATISVSFFTGNHRNDIFICAGYLELKW